MPSVIRVKNEDGSPHGWKVFCPACHSYHVFSTDEPNEDGARWWFNGDKERPTFKPSMLERDGHGATKRVCHSSVRDGRIHFHTDCTHDWAGRNVELPEALGPDRLGIHRDTCRFGWEGDEGLGERLIAQIVAGTKTATCAPKIAYTDEELAAVYAGVGTLATVVDKAGTPRCTIRTLEVFETTFGDPDPRLVQGEGNGANVVAFQRDHIHAWDGVAVEGTPLRDDTILIAELFELIWAPRERC